MLDVSNQANIKYKQLFYTLAIVLLIILFIYYIHITLYHCPKAKKVGQGKGKEENQTENFLPVKSYRSNFHGRSGTHTLKKGKIISQ